MGRKEFEKSQQLQKEQIMKDIIELQKKVKEAELDRNIDLEEVETKLEKMQEMEKHLKVMHDEMAKSIHIIGQVSHQLLSS